MKKPEDEDGDRCPQCGSSDFEYYWEIHSDVCWTCGYQYYPEDELVDDDE